MTKKKPATQDSMFTETVADLPLFSGTPQPIREIPYIPSEEPKTESLFDRHVYIKQGYKLLSRPANELPTVKAITEPKEEPKADSFLASHVLVVRPTPNNPEPTTDAPAIKKSKFYLCKEFEVWHHLGEFESASKAERQMYYIANRTETELMMERKPEYENFRAVRGDRIINSKMPYTIKKTQTQTKG